MATKKRVRLRDRDRHDVEISIASYKIWILSGLSGTLFTILVVVAALILPQYL